MINPEFYAALNAAHDHACEKHPWPDDMPAAKMQRKLRGEVAELGEALLLGDPEKIREEAAQVAAVAARIFEVAGCILQSVTSCYVFKKNASQIIEEKMGYSLDEVLRDNLSPESYILFEEWWNDPDTQRLVGNKLCPK